MNQPHWQRSIKDEIRSCVSQKIVHPPTPQKTGNILLHLQPCPLSARTPRSSGPFCSSQTQRFSKSQGFCLFQCIHETLFPQSPHATHNWHKKWASPRYPSNHPSPNASAVPWASDIPIATGGIGSLVDGGDSGSSHCFRQVFLIFLRNLEIPLVYDIFDFYINKEDKHYVLYLTVALLSLKKKQLEENAAQGQLHSFANKHIKDFKDR